MSNPVGYGFTLADFNGIPCIAVGGRSDQTGTLAKILRTRQRPGNPCIIEVDFKVVGDGVYGLNQSLCCFSINSTNGVNGTWNILTPLESDSRFCGMEFNVAGEFLGTFVADACDHLSSFFSEKKVAIRLTVERLGDLNSGWFLPSTGGTVGPFSPT